MIWNRERTSAALIGLGIWVLLSRTIIMLAGGAHATHMAWVFGLLVLEFLLNVSGRLAAVWWWIGATAKRANLTLRLTAAAIVVHAVRVAIYILGRSGPWHDFDIRPEFRAEQAPSGTGSSSPVCW